MLKPTQGPRSAQFGEIYSVPPEVATSRPERAVVVLIPDEDGGEVGEPQLVVAPLSPELEFAAEGDLLVLQDVSPLGYAFMVEVWHQIGVLKRSLGELIGVLSAEQREALARTWSSLAADEGPVMVTVDPNAQRGLAQDDRQVAAFRDREFEAFRYLSRPLMEAVGRREEEVDAQALPGAPPLPVLLDTLRVTAPVVQESVWTALQAASRNVPASRLVRYLVGALGESIGRARMALGEFLARLARQAQRLVEGGKDVVAMAKFTTVPAEIGAFAGVPRERFRVQAVREDGRLTVVAWETDAGKLRVDVQTPEAEDHGRTVRVVLLGEGEPLVGDVTVERYVYEGQPYGSVGRWMVGPFAEQAARLGGECAVVAAFLEGAGTERDR